MKCITLLLVLLAATQQKQVLNSGTWYGRCQEYQDVQDSQNLLDTYSLSLKEDQAFISIAAWYKLKPIRYTNDHFTANSDTKYTFIQHIFSLFDGATKLIQIYLHNDFKSIILQDFGSAESTDLVFEIDLGGFSDWVFIAFETDFSDNTLLVYNPIEDEERQKVGSSQLDKSSWSEVLTLKLGQPGVLIEKEDEDWVNFGYCGEVKSMMYDEERYERGEEWQKYSYYYRSDEIEELVHFENKAGEVREASVVDNKVHLEDLSGMGRNITVESYRDREWVRVEGGVELSPFRRLQVTLSMWFRLEEDDFLVKLQRLQHRLLGVGYEGKVVVCVDETRTNECGAVEVGLDLREWNQLVITMFEVHLQWRSYIFFKGEFYTLKGQMTQPYQHSKADRLLVNSKVAILRVWNGIEIDGAMQINQLSTPRSLICALEQRGECVEGCDEHHGSVAGRFCLAKCRAVCEECTAEGHCITCAGNREGPPLCSCPERTFLNDFKRECEGSLSRLKVESGEIVLSAVDPFHVLRYRCEEEIECGNYGSKSVHFTQSFGRPFDSVPKVEIAVSALRFLGEDMGFMVQPVYTTRTGFKIALNVQPKAQLEDVTLQWVAFTKDSSIFGADIYFFNADIQKAIFVNNGVLKFEINQKSYFNSQDDLSGLKLLSYLSGLDNIQLKAPSQELTVKISMDVACEYGLEQKAYSCSLALGENFLYSMIRLSLLVVEPTQAVLDERSSAYEDDESHSQAVQPSRARKYDFFGLGAYSFVLQKIQPLVGYIYYSPLGFSIENPSRWVAQSLGNSYISRIAFHAFKQRVQCHRIVHARCKYCSILSGRCLTCLDRYAVPPDCDTCISGAFLDDTCKLCDRRCSECLSSSHCSSCKAQFGPAPKCNLCVHDNFYDNLDPLHPVCLPCSTRCNGCIQHPDVCLACKDASQLVLGVGNKCLDCASENRYFNGQYCMPCPKECYGCTNDKACVRCSEFRGHPPSCYCEEGYFENENDDCMQCHPTCQTCTSYGMRDCLACNRATNRIFAVDHASDERTCECAPRFFFASEFSLDQFTTEFWTCYPCHYSCWKCDGPKFNECTHCSGELDDRQLDLNECQCKDKYYEDSSGYCKQCYRTCFKCLDDREDHCTECERRIVEINEILTFEAFEFLLTNSNSTSLGPCIPECPGPDYWGEPTSGVCRYGSCSIKYNRKKRQCCFFDTDDCKQAFQVATSLDQLNTTLIYYKFSDQLALPDNWEQFFVESSGVSFPELELSTQYNLSAVAHDLRLLDEVFNQSYLPSESRTRYKYVASDFTVIVHFAHSIMQSTVLIKFPQDALKDPFGVALSVSSQKSNVTYRFQKVDLIDQHQQLYDLHYMVVLSYILAWLLFFLISACLQSYLFPIIDFFQETYILGFSPIEIPIQIQLYIRTLYPFFFQVWTDTFAYYRGQILLLMFGSELQFEGMYGERQLKYRNMRFNLNYISNMTQNILILLTFSVLKQIVDNILFIKIFKEQSFYRMFKKILKYLQAAIYSFQANYYNLVFIFSLMSALCAFDNIREINRNNVFEYFFLVIFTSYVFIMLIQYIGDINYPQRLFSKGYLQYYRFYSVFNYQDRLDSYWTINIFTYAYLRKLSVTLAIFFFKNPILSITIIIMTYTIELTIHIFIFIKKRKDDSLKNQIQSLIIIFMTALKCLSGCLLCPMAPYEMKIQDSENEYHFLSDSYMRTKHDLAENKGFIIFVYVWTVSGLSFFLLISVSGTLGKAFTFQQAKVGQWMFRQRDNFYNQHLNLQKKILQFRSKKELTPKLMHNFSSHFSSSYLCLTITDLKQLFSYQGGSLYLTVWSHLQKNVSLHSQNYRMYDAYRFHSFVIIVTNLRIRNGNGIAVLIYHPSYQINYESKEQKLRLEEIDMKDLRIVEEIHELRENEKFKEDLNFASLSQIQMIFEQCYKFGDLNRRMSDDMPEWFYNCLFNHESCILRQSGVEYDKDCKCNQCYNIKGKTDLIYIYPEWNSWERMQRYSDESKSRHETDPWNAYKGNEKKLGELIGEMDKLDFISQIIISYLGYEDKRINIRKKVLDDLYDNERQYSSEESEESDDDEDFIEKNEDLDIFEEILLENENDEGLELILPFSAQHFLVRMKFLQFKD